MAKQATGEISLSIGALEDLNKQIAEMDTRLAAASGNDSQLRKAFVDQVVAEHTDSVNKTLEQIVSHLRKLDTNVLVGLTARLEDTLKSDFQPTIDTYVAEQVKAQAPPEGNVEEIKTARKALVERDKAIRTILESFDVDTSVVEPPKSRGGRPPGSATGTGKSGKNKENYQFTMDGKNRPPSQNTFSSLAYYATEGVPNALGQSDKKDDRWGAKQLKEFLAEHGVKFGEDDTWEVELPNQRKIGAYRMAPEAPAEAPASGAAEAA